MESKLTDWENEPKLDDLKRDLQEAKPFHDEDVAKVNSWLDVLNGTGKHKQNNGKGRSNVVPKLARKQAEWRYPALSEPFLNTPDLFNAEPVTYEDKQAAIQNALVLNNQFNTKMNRVSFIDELVRAHVNEGTCIYRVGWEFEERLEEVEPYIDFQPNPEFEKTHLRLHRMMQIAPEQFAAIPLELLQAHQMYMQDGVPYEPITVTEELVTVKNHPTVEVCAASDVYADPTAKGKIEKVEFVIYEFDTSKSALQKTGKYTNLDKIESKAFAHHETENYHGNDSESFNFSDEPRKKLTAYEYWGYWDIDGSGETTAIKATWVEDTLIELIENPFPNGEIPFIFSSYIPKRNSLTGEPDAELLEDNQRIVGAITRGLLDSFGRSANAQQGMNKGLLDPINEKRYNDGKDFKFNPGVDPRSQIIDFQYPEIPSSAQYMLDLQNAEAEALTGIKAFSQGITGDSLGSSVGGQRNALDAAGKRETAIVRRVAEGIIAIGRKFIGMNAIWLSEEEVIRITNEEFVTVKRDDLEGNIDLRLTISTVEADNAKAQQLAFMLQTTGPSSDPAETRMIRAEIARLNKMPDFAKRIESYVPEPDPLEEEIKQLQIEKLKAEIQNELAKAHENQANGDLDNAKANQLNSLTDKQNLDFIEQESGVAHQRDVDKVQSQARGNMALKAMDHESKMQQEQLKQQGKPNATN